MLNLFKGKQVQLPVPSSFIPRCHKKNQPHSPKIAQNLKIRPRHSVETWSPVTRWRSTRRKWDTFPPRPSLSAVAISIKLSPLLVFAVVATITAIRGQLFTSEFDICVLLPLPLFISFLCYFWLQWQQNQHQETMLWTSVVRTLLGSGKFSHWKLKQRTFAFFYYF